MNLTKKIKEILKHIVDAVNIFDIPKLTREISCDVKHIRSCYEESRRAIDSYKKDLEKERADRQREQNLFVSVIDHLDDLLWAKDTEGRYIVANKAFREKFCYGMLWEELQGKTDIEIAKIFKDRVGDNNHTFGELCKNSDEIIFETQTARQFLEFGKIDGKMVKLVVNKSPMYNFEGTMFATCGVGRDVTEWHDALEDAVKRVKCGCKCFGEREANLIIEEINRLKFEVGDHVSNR